MVPLELGSTNVREVSVSIAPCSMLGVVVDWFSYWVILVPPLVGRVLGEPMHSHDVYDFFTDVP